MAIRDDICSGLDATRSELSSLLERTSKLEKLALVHQSAIDARVVALGIMERRATSLKTNMESLQLELSTENEMETVEDLSGMGRKELVPKTA